MATIQGRFSRSAQGGPFLSASATVARIAGGVSLEVPAGSVSGSMDNETAAAVGSALVAAAGGSSAQSAQSGASVSQAETSYTGWTIVVEGDEATLCDEDGAVVHTFRAPPAATFKG